MPAPEDIEWDESTTTKINPEDVEWDESTTTAIGAPAESVSPFEGAQAASEISLQAKRPNPFHAFLAATTGNMIPAAAPVGNREPMSNLGPTAALGQGMTRNYLDEIAGAHAQTQADLLHIAGEGEGDPTQQTYQRTRDTVRDIEKQYRRDNPLASFGLNVLGGAVTSPITSTAGVVGEGMLSGAGASRELNVDTVRDATVGGLLSFAGKQAGDLIGEGLSRLFSRGADAAGRKVAEAEGKAQQMAAEGVAEEIGSAKAALGSRTQEANRFVENLIRLEAAGALTAEQAKQLAALRQSGVLPALEQKLANAMLEEVPGAAGRIDTARAAFQDLSMRAPEATDEAAAAILSGAEAKRQVGERLKRYLPTVAGAMYGAGPGALAGWALGGGTGSALIGGLAGSALRPALRAGQRMMGHPSVQNALYSPLQSFAARGAATLPGAMSSVGAAVGRTPEAIGAESSKQPSEGDMAEMLALQNPEALGPYAERLQRASAEGNLALVHWGLQQTDPQYRQLLAEARKAAQ